MIEVPVYNQQGQEIDKLQVDEAKLGGTVREALLKQAVVMYHANQRQGTVRTKRRGEVEGSTRKIYRQKGTGNARMGTVRQPVRVGGGHAKQKLPKDWRQAMPKKARRLARNSAILAKLQANHVRVVDKIELPEPKTKLMAQVIAALGIERTCLFAIPEAQQETLLRASRNLPRTRTTSVRQLNAWDLLRNHTLLITREGFDAILHDKNTTPDD